MSKISNIIIAIYVMVGIIVLVYAIFLLNMNWKKVVILLILSTIINLIINERKRHKEQNSRLPYNISNKDNIPIQSSLHSCLDTDISVKRETNSAVRSYIEVLTKEDNINIFNLEDGVGEKFHIGDKIVIDRDRISSPDFMLGFLAQDSRYNFLSQKSNILIPLVYVSSRS